mgnify:CR=1 FL=1
MKKTKKEKLKIVEDLKTKFSQNPGYVIFSLLNLDGETLQGLRLQAREKKGVIEVSKKNLIYKSNPQFPFNDKELNEPFGFIWILDEELSALKTLKDYKKEEEIKILGGYFKGKKLSSSDVWELVDLPSKEELISRLNYSLSFLLRRLTYDLKMPFSKLLLILSAIKK